MSYCYLPLKMSRDLPDLSCGAGGKLQTPHAAGFPILSGKQKKSNLYTHCSENPWYKNNILGRDCNCQVLKHKQFRITVNSLIKGQGAEARTWLKRGHFQIQEAFYRMKIGPFLAEAKNVKFKVRVPLRKQGVPSLGEAPLLENLQYLWTGYVLPKEHRVWYLQPGYARYVLDLIWHDPWAFSLHTTFSWCLDLFNDSE